MWIAGGAGFLLTMCPKEDVCGRFCKLGHCGGALACGIAGDAPMSLRDRALRNSGRVPLSLQKNAKGGEQGAQLACGSNKCPLPSNAFSCEPRGSHLPPSRRPAPGGSSTLGVGRSWGLLLLFMNRSYMYRAIRIVGVNTIMFTTARKIMLPT